MLFFPGAAVFRLAESVWSVRHKCQLITMIIRARKNVVAYFEAQKPGISVKGRPRKYGEKVKISELFDYKYLFSKVECTIYGKTETISIASVDLLWKPTANLIRFVLAVTSRGPIILMCSDLCQNPVAALELYCSRVRIETMFDMLKNLMHVFEYRFWTKWLPRHSRKPLKNKYLKRPVHDNMARVHRCYAAYERFVMIGAIALGLLQLIALKYETLVWKEFQGFLRTKSRSLPSERTVRSVMHNLLVKDLCSFAPGMIMRKIQEYIFKKKLPGFVCQRTYLNKKLESIDI